MASGQEVAVGVLLGSSSPEGHCGEREGLRGPSQHGGLRAGAGDAPAGGHPSEGSAAEMVRETEASTVAANGHPRTSRPAPWKQRGPQHPPFQPGSELHTAQTPRLPEP